MVEKETLIQALDEQRQKFNHPKVAKDFSSWNKTMQYHFTDRGEYYLIRFVEGRPLPPAEEQHPKPDIQYEMDSATFFAITQKEISGFKAYQQKRIRLKAAMPDMLKLQKIDKL